MSGEAHDYNENQQSVEFYKIKLMEKQREVSEFAAKLKKIQFKNSRDLKQLKMLQEKAKNQLKDQKQKSDKLAKNANQAIEQNAVLQHRLAELKEEKDKQIQTVRNQYNHLKTQVRSYERILPTLTFMNKLGAAYDQLPTYEEVFMNWKDKSQKCEDIQNKYKAYKTQTQQKIEMQQKVYENLNKKKLQIQKQLRDDITKLLDLQTQVTTMAMERDQIRSRYQQTYDQLNSANQTNEQLMEETKSLQAKLQQIIREYHSQIQMKDEEIHKLTIQQARKLEEEIDRITKVYETRENSHLQQLAYFEQEEHRFHEKAQKDKQKYEDSLREMESEVEYKKTQIQMQKQQNKKQRDENKKIQSELDEKSNQCAEYLEQIRASQIKIEQIERKLKQYQKKIFEFQNQNFEKFNNQNREKKLLQQKVEDMQNQLNQLKQELTQKDQQLTALHYELDEIKNKNGESGRGNFPVINSYESQHGEPIRNRSNTQEPIEFQKVNTIHPKHQQSKQVRSRQASNVSQRLERRNTSVQFYSNQQLQNKIKELTKEYEQKMQKTEKKIQQVKRQTENQLKLKHEKQMNSKIQEEKQRSAQLKKKIQQLQQQIKKMNQDYQRQKNQLNESMSKITKKYDILKIQRDALEQNCISQANQSKKDKQGLNLFKNQNRELQKSAKEYQRCIQSLNTQLQVLKKYKQKTQAKEAKEKSVSSQSSSTNMKQIMEKYTTQINKLIQQKQQEIKLSSEKSEQIQSLKKQIQDKIKEKDLLQQQANEKSKQNQMLQDLLQHQRKDRTLRAVPSLAALTSQTDKVKQQKNFKEFYNQAGEKQGKIIILEREVDDLKHQLSEVKQKNSQKIASLEEETKVYIQQIIQMKMKVANAEMKASEKLYLYNQLKKKMNIK